MNNLDIKKLISLCKEISPNGSLHEPILDDQESVNLNQCINKNEISYLGGFVSEFADKIAEYTHAKYVLPVVNGTCALTLALKVLGADDACEVIVPAISFVATANAVRAVGATPLFVDIDQRNLGMAPSALIDLIEFCAEMQDGQCVNRFTRKRIIACIPVHILGFPADICAIKNILNKYNIAMIEDAAAALGSFVGNDAHHCGTIGIAGILSFNGNKIISTGGGGALLTNDVSFFELASHLSTQAKLPHKFEYDHSHVGYNYRMNNLSAAVGSAQMDKLKKILSIKEQQRKLYESFFYEIFCDPSYLSFCGYDYGGYSIWNNWLVPIFCKNRDERDFLLHYFLDAGVYARPLWRPLNTLRPYSDAKYSLRQTNTAQFIADRVICLPNGVSYARFHNC